MSIRELGKNKYKIEVVIGYNGDQKIRHYETFYGKKSDAKLRDSEIKAQVKAHTFIKNTKKTVRDLMNEYLNYNKDNWAPKTYVSNEIWINNINKSIGHVHLQDLNVKILENFYSELKNLTKEIIDKETKQKKVVPKYSDKTIQHHYVLINGALNKAIQWDYINYNINQKIEKPKVRKKIIECYNKNDIRNLLKVLECEPLKSKAIILLAIDSGMRRGELTGLTWEDVDFEEKSVKVNKTTQYLKGLGIFEKPTKSENSDRIIYITDTTIKILKQYRKEQLTKKLKLGDKWGNSKRVFTTNYGFDMHPDTPSQIFRNIIKKNKLKKISFHALRHSSASLLISEGIQLQIISRKLGHSNVSFTDKTYSHIFNEEFIETANKMGSIFDTKTS